MGLTLAAWTAVIVLLTVYFFLITEKVDKVIVASIGATVLILTQIFRSADHSSQENAFEFVSRNLDVLGFVVGMMVLINIVRKSGIFETIAIALVKFVRGNPRLLLIGVGYLAFVMTIFISNIPTVLILSPVLLVLIRELKLPYFPFFFMMIAMANIGGATTPISDPTTYYQAKTANLSFMEVVRNSGLITIALSIITTIYGQIVFRKQLAAVKVKEKAVALFRPLEAIRNRFVLRLGVPILLLTILLMVLKEQIAAWTGIRLDNATLVGGAAVLCMILFRISPQKALQEYIGWEVIFFFLGLFIVVGALEFNGVIDLLSQGILSLTHGQANPLLFLMTVGSAFFSVFIDNVPYNITMVGAIQSMAKTGIDVYPLWWALNLGTSIGGAGSMIGAACNVLALGQAEKEKFHTNFLRYLGYGFPLVMINALIAYGMLWFRFLA